MIIYRIFLFLVAPLVVLTLLLRRLRGTENWREISERFGRISANPTKNAPVIWVHGASLGEMTAARPVLERLIFEIQGLEIVATTNTVTARKMVSGWANPAITAQMAPLDYEIVLNRFIRNWQPLVAISLENEIWPTRILTCDKRRIPMAVLGGRISENAAQKWSKRKKVAKKLFKSINYLAPMDKKNGNRFLQLGLPADRLGQQVNLKPAVRLDDADSNTLKQLQKTFPRKQTYLAASTHEGDEELILTAFSNALKDQPNLKLILAPRHPNRGDEIVRLLKSKSLPFSRRSVGHDPDNTIAVYLVDTIGEMALWYSLAKATIIGGTFSNVGGHTPIEPIQFNSIVVYGPDTSNNDEAYAALQQNNAAIAIQDGTDLQNIFTTRDENLDLNKICKRAEKAVRDLRLEKSDTSEFIGVIKAFVASST